MRVCKLQTAKRFKFGGSRKLARGMLKAAMQQRRKDKLAERKLEELATA